MSRNDFKIFVGNLSEQVTENLLYELFLQAGPVTNVIIPTHQGKQRPFGFVEFKHQCSVPYAICLMEGVQLFGTMLKLGRPRGSSNMPITPFPLGVQAPPIIELPNTHTVPPLQGSIVRPKESFADDYVEPTGELRNRIKPHTRHADYLMPSNRSKRVNAPSKKDLDAIPDFLGSGFDPLYYSGVDSMPSYQSNSDSRREDLEQSHRREPYKRDDGRSHRKNYESSRRRDRQHYEGSRHDRHPYTSNRRKHN